MSTHGGECVAKVAKNMWCRSIAVLVGLIVFVVQAKAASVSFASGSATQVFDTSLIKGGPYYLNDHTFIQAPDGRWHLFGIFHAEPFGSDSEFDFIHAVATEKDPAKWHSDSFRVAPDPYAIALHVDRSLGETHIWAPHVVRAGDRYFMVYHAGGTDQHKAQIRIAQSFDLYRWERVGPSALFADICVARDPMLFHHDKQWIMYYTRCDSLEEQHSGVAYRTSTDLTNWSEPKMALVLRDVPPMFNSGYTESPFVFEQNGWFYLSVTSYPIEWTATMVYRSKNPFEFSPQPIARLSAHAAEWIFPQHSSRAFISHCGAGQRGAWIAPVSLPVNSLFRRK